MGNKDKKPLQSEPLVSGFGKDVNDYLNHYVTVADAKAAAILAANFVLLGGLMNLLPNTCFSKVTFYVSGVLSLASLMFCVTTLYPRLANAGKGLVFWQSIRKHSLTEYISEVQKLSQKDVEVEYAKQNWHVSSVLSSKNSHVRLALWMFMFSLIVLAVCYVSIKIS